MQHTLIYREPGRYAGWPANYGIWGWGDEIVLGFTAGYPDPAGGFHARDRGRPFVTLLARSVDGGITWRVAPFAGQTPGQRALSADEHMQPALGALAAIEAGMPGVPSPCPGGINFTHPDFALMCARTGLRAGSRSWFYYSYNRCQTWQGPFSIPDFGQPGISARTDYLVHGPLDCTLFLTAVKSNGDEGRVFCARTSDGGASFQFRAWIGPEPAGYAIMPASVQVSSARILTAIRCRGGGNSTAAQHWIDLYASNDEGATWEYLGRPAPDTGSGGNPPALIKLRSGRLCLTYGYRAEPYGIRARLSADGGATWGEEIVLRDDAGSHDIGYVRSVQRSDGTVFSAYYYNDRLGGAGYIAATLWRPAGE